MIPSSCAISSKYIQRGLSRDETAPFMTVKKGQSPFLTKGLQSAARIICSLKANKFHTCRLRSVFCDVHAAVKNGSILLCRLRAANSARLLSQKGIALLEQQKNPPAARQPGNFFAMRFYAPKGFSTSRRWWQRPCRRRCTGWPGRAWPRAASASRAAG